MIIRENGPLLPKISEEDRRKEGKGHPLLQPLSSQHPCIRMLTRTHGKELSVPVQDFSELTWGGAEPLLSLGPDPHRFWFTCSESRPAISFLLLSRWIDCIPRLTNHWVREPTWKLEWGFSPVDSLYYPLSPGGEISNCVECFFEAETWVWSDKWGEVWFIKICNNSPEQRFSRCALQSV